MVFHILYPVENLDLWLKTMVKSQKSTVEQVLHFNCNDAYEYDRVNNKNYTNF